MTFVEEDNLAASTGLRVRTSPAPAGSALHQSSGEASREDRDSLETIYCLKVRKLSASIAQRWLQFQLCGSDGIDGIDGAREPGPTPSCAAFPRLLTRLHHPLLASFGVAGLPS